MKVQHGFSQKEPMHSLLQSHKLEPVHVPFLEHEGLNVAHPTVIPQAVLVSSARTVQYWGEWGRWIRRHSILVIAISKKTQLALEQRGIQSRCARGTGEHLVGMLDETDCSSFVHIGALEPSSNLQNSLRNQSKPYSRIPVYSSRPCSTFSVGEGVVLGCLNSERCATIWSVHAPQIPVVCIGQTTKARAFTLGLDIQGVAREPTREALAEAAVAAVEK